MNVIPIYVLNNGNIKKTIAGIDCAIIASTFTKFENQFENFFHREKNKKKLNEIYN